MKLKKILACFLACSMVATCFVSCNNENNKDKQNSTPNESSTVSDVEDDLNNAKDNLKDDVNKAKDDVKDNLQNAKDNVSDAISDTESKVQSETDKMLNDSSERSKDEGSLDFPTIANNALSNKKYCWGQGTNVDENNIPISCTQFQNKYKNFNALFIEKNCKDIYLTFDEGYENGYTEKILDILKEKSCPAVFFVTMPYVKENPNLIKRMLNEGHVVGNHTVTHPSMPDIPIEEARKEIKDLHTYVKQNFDNYDMYLFRPPMGEFSEATLSLAQNLGYYSVFWSFAYKDWDPNNQPDPKCALNKLVKSAHNGAIYLLHAVSKTNTEILGEFIDTMRAQGYNFKIMK